MVEEKTIDKKDYLKINRNLYFNHKGKEFQGCLFIYDDGFDKYNLRIKWWHNQ